MQRGGFVHQGRLDPGVDLVAKPFTYTNLGSKIRGIIDGAANVDR